MAKRKTAEEINATEKHATENNGQNVGKNGKSTRKLAENLDFLYLNSDAINPVTRQKYTKDDYLTDFISIASTTLQNFKNQSVSADRLRTLQRIIDGANSWISKNEKLKLWFPDGVDENDLLTKRLEDCADKSRGDERPDLYFYKLVGTYLCYYNSTHSGDSSRVVPNYGVLQIGEPDERGECSCSGVFTIKDFQEAQRIHNEVEINNTPMVDATVASVFKGRAFIKRNLLWVTLNTINRQEFVSLSFDLDPKILEKNPLKPFKGVRGLALSQSSGRNEVSVVFPMIIKKTEIMPSRNELRKYLAFDHKTVDEESSAIRSLASNLLVLINSLQSMKIDDGQRLPLVAKFLASRIETILQTQVYTKEYFEPDEIDEVYNEVILPEAKDNRESDDD